MPEATRAPACCKNDNDKAATGALNQAAVQLRTYIVEDNPTIRENLIGALEELASIKALGWAETEGQATDWLAQHHRGWDLAIVDLFLKQGSGLGVLEACRSRATGQRVVVLSNYATTDMRKRCMQLGADAVFDKSNEIDALVEYCILQSEGPRPDA
jgi:two-component system, OmpR family, response regulator